MSTTVTSWEGAETFGAVYPGWAFFPIIELLMVAIIGFLFYFAWQAWQIRAESGEYKEALRRFNAGEFDPLISALLPPEEATGEKEKAGTS